MLENSILRKIKIKNCEEKDYSFVYRLTKRNMEGYVRKFWGGWNPAMFKKNFKIQNIKIIEYKKKKIGFYDIERKDGYLYVHNVQITISFQGKGIGNYIMSLIEKKASKLHLPEIKLSVFKSNPAKEFYLFLGYEILEDKDHSVLMKKTL